MINVRKILRLSAVTLGMIAGATSGALHADAERVQERIVVFEQEKVTLVLTFYKKDKIIRKKKIFNLYPLVIVPKQNRGVTFDLYEKPGFDKVTIDLFDLNNKFINSRSLIL